MRVEGGDPLNRLWIFTPTSGVAGPPAYDGDDDDLSFLLLRYEDCLHTRGKFLLPVVAERSS